MLTNGVYRWDSKEPVHDASAERDKESIGPFEASIDEDLSGIVCNDLYSVSGGSQRVP
jgi:hypothetical protein